MAATLFIIKIPKEEKNETQCPFFDKFKNEDGDDEKTDSISPVVSEKKESLTNCQPQTFSFDETDLEVDAMRVIDAKENEESRSTKVSTPTETNGYITTENADDEEEEDINFSEKTEVTDALIDAEESELKHASSGKIITSTPDNEKCANLERADEGINNNSPIEEKTINEPTSPEVTMLDFILKESLETKLKNVFEQMSITNVTWSDVDGYQQAFFVDCGDPNRVEDILEKLITIGIGQKIVGTSVSLFPATVHIENDDDNKQDESPENLQKEDESEFLKSVKSRMIVAQVVETVRSNAVFTFDYCMLIILASMIACIGLIENSSVILVASMLISPLMGPILAGTFGITIQNGPLRNLGIRSECIGLVMCIVCGFICGLVVGGIQLHGLTGYVDEWPTLEMKSRGMSRSLWVGVFIALPSGAGVALSVLGGNTGSLVGVAISASLLPPAVNAGMLWAFSLLTVIIPPESIPLNNSTELTRNDIGCLPFKDNNYEPVWSCDMSKETGIMGALSLLLTLINIFCIFLVGVIMLKIKEVVPQTSSASTVEFWGSDLKVARDSYKTMKGPESVTLRQKFKTELEKIKAQEREENQKRDIDWLRIFDRMSTLPKDPYWTLPYDSPTPDENKSDPQTHHTIHSIPYSKLFHYETIVPSPGIRVVRPFSFHAEPSPVKRSKSKRSKKLRFSIGEPKKNKFTITSVPESSLMKSISEEQL